MLQVSEQAKAMLKNSLDDGGQEGQIYRLVRNGDDLALGIGGIEEGDTVYDHMGQPVLATPTELAQEFEETIDVEQTTEGARLILTE